MDLEVAKENEINSEQRKKRTPVQIMMHILCCRFLFPSLPLRHLMIKYL